MLNDVPLISKAWVVGYESEQRLLYIMFPSAQIPMPVKMLFHGPADAVSVHQPEMPKIGTMGLALFPNGDSRSGFWLGAIYNSGTNAITSESNTPFENYNSYWCGAFKYLDESGNFTYWLPDGTYFQVAETSGVPTMYRHSYDNTTYPPKINREEFPISERIPNQPPAKQVNLVHPSGTTFNINSSGQVKVEAAGTSITMDTSGNISMSLGSGNTISANGTSDSLTLASLIVSVYNNLVSTFNNHVHVDPQGGSTAPPTTPATTISSSDVESTIWKSGS